ncbi:lyase family protein [Kitasatospora kifunensis]|uniref:argininosuccinate lyase n=1 Tax=Kitasatospora kifunensis TaxID=58351 RepID=A0A7W7R7K8_KITKI|nr:lyase family protein [Kitasatospora kifunensis]MBB4926905.1 argininosuccinate lyase [Kitasatospora kifunensis]
MSPSVPNGYLGSEARITRGPAREMVEAGYAAEIADAALLHHGLGLADLVHLLTLHEMGVVPDAAASELACEILQITQTPASAFPYAPVYGDAYNSRERELERRLGPTAGWLHTSRTRREAGRIAFRLALRDQLLDLHEAVAGFVVALSRQACAHADTVWADNTYLQPAQPSTFGHYLGGFGEEVSRHLDRLESAYALADRSPAGVGGVGGPRLPFERERLADRLGFASVGAHTRDAMWAIDGVTDAALAAVHSAITADRLAEDLEIFTSPGFGYVSLDPSLCRASVLMPQKRNPYALAVVRATASSLIGKATGLLVTARTPSARTDNWLHTYGEVTQALELGRRVVALTAEAVRTLQVDEAALRTVAGAHFTGSADLAEELVLRCGVDYRSAYRVVGRAVADAVAAGQTTLTSADLGRAAKALLGHSLALGDRTVQETLDPERIVATRTVTGGSAPERVREHARALAERAADAAQWRKRQRVRIRSAEDRLLSEARALAEGRQRDAGNVL